MELTQSVVDDNACGNNEQQILCEIIPFYKSPRSINFQQSAMLMTLWQYLVVGLLSPSQSIYPTLTLKAHIFVLDKNTLMIHILRQ